MKDFLGNHLMVGDSVVIMQPSYRNFVYGRIVGNSQKQVYVDFINPVSKNTETTRVYPEQTIKTYK